MDRLSGDFRLLSENKAEDGWFGPFPSRKTCETWLPQPGTNWVAYWE
jgi:hypothetical protein